MVKCPRCGDAVEASGEMTLGGGVLTVYQCDRCTRMVDFGGVAFEAAMTFALDADGNLIDPNGNVV